MSGSSLLPALSRNFLTIPCLRSQISNIGSISKRWMCAATSQKQSQSVETGSGNTTSNPVDQSTDDSSNNNSTVDAATTQKNEELTKQLEKANTDMAELKDKYQRSLAERENVRTRLEKQVVEAKLYATQGFCKDLLEVTDVFRKALESVSKEQLSEGSEQMRTLYSGLSMTETQLITVLRRNGLSLIDLELGIKFDPSWQEAMFEVPCTEAVKPGHVAHVMRPGWKLHDRCIRSAQVGVAKEA